MTLLNSASAEIKIKKNGTMYTKTGAEKGSVAYPIFFNSIISVHLEVKMSEISLIEIRLKPTFDDAMEILQSGLLGMGVGTSTDAPKDEGKTKNPAGLSASGTAASAAKGPTDALLKNTVDSFAQMYVRLFRPTGDKSESTPWWSGAVTQPDVTMDNGEIEIILRGYANTVFLSGPEYVTKIQDLSILEIIEKMTALIGKTIEFDSDDTVTKSHLMSTKISGDRKENALATIKWALGHGASEMRMGQAPDGKEDDTRIIVRRIDSMFKQIPKYTFVQWRQIDPKLNVYPMLKFNLRSARTLFIQGRAFGIYNLGVDSKKKESLSSAFGGSDASFPETATSDQTSIEPDISQKNKPGFHVEYYKRSEAQDTSKQNEKDVALDLATYQMFTFEICGLPDLAPMQLVQISVSDIPAFQGVLLVTKITHSWNGDWLTEVEGRMSGGFGGKITKPLGFVAPATPTTDVGGTTLTPTVLTA